jgi:hypothetical protein
MPSPHCQQNDADKAEGPKHNSKSHQKRRSKRDYAAWAGATPQSRAAASAMLSSNADAPGSQPRQGALQAVPGQPRTPDGTRGFSMGRGRPVTQR